MAKIHPNKKFQFFKHIAIETEITDVVTKLGAFKTNASFYCFLAALGFKEGMKIPRSEQVNWGEAQETVFSNNSLEGQIYAIALADSQDYSILKDKDESYRIFEEYVNGGFEYLFNFSKEYSDEIEFVDSLLELVRKKSLDNEVFEDPVVEDDLDLDK